MRIHVRTVNLEMDRNTRAGVESRLQASLARLAHRILRVAVRIRDENGPRGGEDIACLLEIRLRPRGRLFIKETDIDLPGAVGKAAGTAATAVVRALEKSRDSHRKTRSVRLFGSPDDSRHTSQLFA